MSRAIVTPSLVMTGAPKDLASTTLRPLGPSVTLTASASLSTPRSSARRASSSKLRVFAMGFLPRTMWACKRPGLRCCAGRGDPPGGLLLDDREDVARGQHEVLLARVLDLGAAVLAVQDDVADADV